MKCLSVPTALRRARRRRRSGRRPSRAAPGWCRPGPTGRASPGRRRRPHRGPWVRRPGSWTTSPDEPSLRWSAATPGRSPSTAGSSPAAPRASRCGSPRLEHPASVGGDPDRHHVVRVRVDRGEHAARRDAGDARARSERPPKTTATRRLRRMDIAAPDPTGGASAGGDASLRCVPWPTRPCIPSRRGDGRPPAARAGPAAQHADHDGLDVRRRRRARVRPLRQPHLDRVRGRARRARGRALPGVRERARGGRHRARPGRARREGGGAAARLPRQPRRSSTTWRCAAG